MRPLPPPPRCRGIELDSGDYTGCLYGYGDLKPFSGPRDCPVCYGSGIEGGTATIIPHANFGDPGCCGCLTGVAGDEAAYIVCNECGVVVRTVPSAALHQVLDEMELALDMDVAMCAHCRAVNLFPGLSKVEAFICQQCGRGAAVGD
jgi:hypothetical protein